MSPAKFVLLLEILALFFLKISHILGDARLQLQCEQPTFYFWQKFAVWFGIVEKSKVCLTTQEIVQNTSRGLFGAFVALLICEVIRTVGCYFILFEGHTEISMTEDNFRRSQFANWDLILRRNPKFVIHTNRGDCPDEYLVRTVNMLTTTTVNVHTGRVHSWVRPRLLVY